MYIFCIILIAFFAIQLIYAFIFYKTEKRQLNQLEAKVLVKSNGIYFELIIMSLLNLILGFFLWLFVVITLGFPPITEATLLHCLVLVITNILVFLIMNYFTLKPFNAFYFCEKKIIRIKYNSLLQSKEKEIIEIGKVHFIKMFYFRKGIIFQLSTKNNDSINRYFNGYQMNIQKIEKFCYEKSIEFECSHVSFRKFRELKSYID